MAYNDVNIIKDASQQPVPQYLNGVGSAYEPVLGANGATRTMIYDASGNPLFTGANPGLVQLAGRKVIDHTFHDAATVATDGFILNTEGADSLLLEIYGTSAARTVEFKGAGTSDIARPIVGIRLSDYTIASSTAGNEELWRIDIRGMTKVMIVLSSVSGGNVTVKGRIVS